ncbi:MAG: transketolase C-terminal domain-containing protein [Candidatus Undinarchaeales archaeon]|jgi:transketolase|nr:transketolase C-terminal domain-containing protein [Candidatus Undinarchaeales archaeon]
MREVKTVNLAKKVKAVSIRSKYGEKLVKLAAKNKNIVALTSDVKGSVGFKEFAKRFENRFFQIGIAEQNMVGIAGGMAVSDKIPFVSTFAVFLPGRVYDQIRQVVAYAKTNTKLVATHAGITVGPDGATHQMLEDIGMMRGLPNIEVLVPADVTQMEKMLEYMVENKGPMFMRLPRISLYPIYKNDYKFTGEAEILRKGSDVTIYSCGPMVNLSLEAAYLLNKKGISAEVVNVPKLDPMDKTLWKSAKKTGAVVTAEDHSVVNGLGSAIEHRLSKTCPTFVRKVGVRGFGTTGKLRELLESYSMFSPDIATAAALAIDTTKGHRERLDKTEWRKRKKYWTSEFYTILKKRKKPRRISK